jgi:hypothetical protein
MLRTGPHTPRRSSGGSPTDISPITLFVEGLGDNLGRLDLTQNPVLSDFARLVRRFRSRMNNFIAEYQGTHPTEDRRRKSLCSEFVTAIYRPFRSDIDALFKPNFAQFLAAVAASYGAAQSSTAFRGLLKLHTTPTDISAAISQLNAICRPLNPAFPAVAADFARVYDFWLAYLELRIPFEHFLFGDFGVATLPSQKHLVQYTGPVPVTASIATPITGAAEELERTRRVVEEKRRRLSQLRAERPLAATIPLLERRRRKLFREADALDQEEAAFVRRQRRVSQKLNPEWVNLSTFVQYLADYTLQTAAGLSDSRNLFSHAEIIDVKRHMADEVDRGMDAPEVSNTSLGPLLALVDRMKNT